MTVHRLPRAIFNLDGLPARAARRELVGRFVQHLSGSFGPIRVYGVWFVRAVLFRLKLPDEEFAVGLARRRKYTGPDYGAWTVSIDPAVGRVFGDVSNEDQRQYAKDLMQISDEVHSLLTDIPGITRLRWFFKGWDSTIPGVGTPADLPWQFDVPELRNTLNKSI